MPIAIGLQPRTKPPEARRRELMDAAERLFIERGVGPATIEQITAAARVAKGTFYLYFASKEDLLAALGERYAQELLARIKTAVAACAAADWRGKLAAWAGAATEGYLDAIRRHDIAFWKARPPTREELVDNPIIDHLADLVRGGAEAQAWAIEDARFTALFLFSGLHAVVDDAYTKEKRINRVRLVRRLEQLCFRAVGIERP